MPTAAKINRIQWWIDKEYNGSKRQYLLSINKTIIYFCSQNNLKINIITVYLKTFSSIIRKKVLSVVTNANCSCLPITQGRCQKSGLSHKFVWTFRTPNGFGLNFTYFNWAKHLWCPWGKEIKFHAKRKMLWKLIFWDIKI